MRFIILLSGLFYSAQGVFCQTPSSDPNWQQIKHWDFTTISPATFLNDWIIDPCDDQFVHSNGTSEPAFYEPENVTLTSLGAELSIKRKIQTKKARCYQPDNLILEDGFPNLRTESYSQAWMKSVDAIQYGYMEARVKIPYGYGYHAGFWTFRDDSYPFDPLYGAGELDVFEMVPSNSQGTYPNNYDIQKTNVHLNYAVGAPSNNEDIQIQDYREWHTYGIKWGPDFITWYFDGQIIRSINNPGLTEHLNTIFNLSLNPIPTGDPINTSVTPVPAKMYIEYISWYQPRLNCGIINSCYYDIASHVEEVYESISIGGTGCENELNNGQEKHFRVSDFVAIEGTLDIKQGAVFSIDIEECY